MMEKYNRYLEQKAAYEKYLADKAEYDKKLEEYDAELEKYKAEHDAWEKECAEVRAEADFSQSAQVLRTQVTALEALGEEISAALPPEIAGSGIGAGISAGILAQIDRLDGMDESAMSNEEFLSNAGTLISALDQISGGYGTAGGALSSIDAKISEATGAIEQGKAQLAYAMRASVPQLNNEGIIELRRARHPLIDKNKVVPVDISLGTDFDTIVITGPNTGGKTVSIKTIGLMSLMAMCGLMLPVDDRSRISVFDHVLADIGDEQSIEQSLSTFSSHMTKIVKILEFADDKSLVLIDELGAGTDPIEGAALAVSILEQLRKQGAKIAATTHYAELKSYALQTSGVINGSCEFDVQSLKPTYMLLIGIPGRSNAFAISKRLGISDEIIEHAQELVSNENVRFEDVVDRLEQSRAKMEKEREEAEKIREEANRELEKAQKLKADIETLRQKELDDAKNRAVRITEQAKREAYQLLNDLEMLKKQQAKEKNAAEMARRARAVIKKDLNAIDTASDPIVSLGNDEDYVLPRPLKIGDTVIIADIGNEATVVTLKDKKGLVTVQMGTMKTRVKEENLRLIEKKKSAEKKRTVATGRMESRMNMKAQTSVDLRGMTVEEGILELDRYIDHALRMGINEFTVIHGKGTGVLRSAVRDYLKKSKYVKTSRLGTFGEGEDGVSIVTLK